jgi:hypothetical protein
MSKWRSFPMMVSAWRSQRWRRWRSLGSPGLKMIVLWGLSEAIEDEDHEPADENDGKDALVEEEEEGAGPGGFAEGRHRVSSLGMVMATVEMRDRTRTRSV